MALATRSAWFAVALAAIAACALDRSGAPNDGPSGASSTHSVGPGPDASSNGSTGGAGGQDGSGSASSASTGGSGATATAASSASGSGGASLCPGGGTSNLTDDFDAPMLDGSKWSQWSSGGSHANAKQTGGFLEVITDGKSDVYAGVDSATTWRLEGCALFAEIDQPLENDPDAFAWFGLFDPNDNANSVGFMTVGLDLYAFHHAAGQDADDILIASATWGKLMDDGSQLTWYTSNDGVSWQKARALKPRPPLLDNPAVVEFAAGEGASTQGGTARFDNLNVTP